MARIRLEEALALGLIPPDQVAGLMRRFPAVGRSQVFGSPLFIRPSTGAGALQRNLFGFGPYGGVQTARFGLGPLLQGLGLSPAPSAVTSPGAVPVGAAARRREELTPEQLMALYGQMERAGANPRSIAPQSIAPTPQPAMNRLRVMGVTPQEVRAIKEAAGPAGGDVTQALSVARKAVGVAKDVLDDQSLLRQVVDPILGLERPSPTRSESAFQAQREGERNPLTFPGAEVGAFRPFTPNAAQTALEGGSVAPPGFDVATAVPFQPSSDVVSGTSGGASAAGAAAELGPEAADALARAVSGGGEAAAAASPAAGSLVGQAGPVLQGLGVAGSLAGLGQNIAAGNIKNSILNAASIASAFLPPPLNFILPLAFGGAGFFGNNEQIKNQIHEANVLRRDVGVAVPQARAGQRAVYELGNLASLPPEEQAKRLQELEHTIQTGLNAGLVFSRAGGPDRGTQDLDLQIGLIRATDALNRLGLNTFEGRPPALPTASLANLNAYAKGPADTLAPFEATIKNPEDEFIGKESGYSFADPGFPAGQYERSLVEFYRNRYPGFAESALAQRLATLPATGISAVSTMLPSPNAPNQPTAQSGMMGSPPWVGDFGDRSNSPPILGGLQFQSGPYSGQWTLNKAAYPSAWFFPEGQKAAVGKTGQIPTQEPPMSSPASILPSSGEEGDQSTSQFPTYGQEGDRSTSPPLIGGDQFTAGPYAGLWTFNRAAYPLEWFPKISTGKAVPPELPSPQPPPAEIASSPTSPLQSAPSLQHGGIVPRTGTYQLHQGETVIPAERQGEQPAQEDLHAYLALDEGGIQWAKKNPDAKKYWRLAFTPQEGRAALLEGNPAEIPVVVPRAVTNLPGRRLVAAVEAARRAQHQDPVRTLGDFLSPAVSVAPPLFDVLAKDSEDLRDPWASHGVPGSPIRDTIVPLTPGPSYRGPQAMPQPMTPGLRESVGVGI